MAATNFSAFTVFGFSRAGWRIGYSFYPIMAFGAGFMTLSFACIGRLVWRLGKEKGLFTELLDKLQNMTFGEKELHNEFYELCKKHDVEVKDFFNRSYALLIDKDHGPKLASFLLTLGDKAHALIKKALESSVT